MQTDKRNEIPLSEKGKREIVKTKQIIALLEGLTVSEVRHIISALQNHLDSCAVVSIGQYELNIQPIFEGCDILWDK